MDTQLKEKRQTDAQQKQANQAIHIYYELIRMPEFKEHLKKIKALRIVPFDGGNGRSQLLLLWRGSGFGHFPRWGWDNRDMYALLKLPLRIKTPELRRVHAVFK